jgi:hypothetical protein
METPPCPGRLGLKDTTIKENVQLELRFEALNVFNQLNSAAPNTSPTNTAFGEVTAENNVPRRVQLSLRIKFSGWKCSRRLGHVLRIPSRSRVNPRFCIP